MLISLFIIDNDLLLLMKSSLLFRNEYCGWSIVYRAQQKKSKLKFKMIEKPLFVLESIFAKALN